MKTHKVNEIEITIDSNERAALNEVSDLLSQIINVMTSNNTSVLMLLSADGMILTRSDIAKISRTIKAFSNNVRIS